MVTGIFLNIISQQIVNYIYTAILLQFGYIVKNILPLVQKKLQYLMIFNR